MKRVVLFVTMILSVVMVSGCSGSGADVQQASTAPPLAAEQQSAAAQQETLPVEGQNDASAVVNAAAAVGGPGSYTIVDTGQDNCYDTTDGIICPSEGQDFYGQDAQYITNPPQYVDNGDGTVTDLNTGLMWQQDPGSKMSYQEAVSSADSFTLAGYDDWRLPTVKELYSLIDFRGRDVSMLDSSVGVTDLTPYINTDYFVFQYGDVSGGSRVLESQWATSTVYNSTVMGGDKCFFGVNFADGRIKCYPTQSGGSGGYFTIYVRGESYGINDFVDNSDGTISDNASGLTWTQDDSGQGMDWGSALSYCEALDTGGYDDWRLPDIKELQSIVDYSRSPDLTSSPALDPMFNATQITNEGGQSDYGFYWSSTTHITYPGGFGTANYISFGRALGYMEEFGGFVDVHGAGAQRSDPKMGEASYGNAPQGDIQRILNYARCVRGGAELSGFTGYAETGTAGGAGGQPPEGQQPPSGGEGQLPEGQQPPEGGPPEGGNGQPPNSGG